MLVAEAPKCTKPEIEALLNISVPTDLEGNPFFLHSTPYKHRHCQLEFYHCINCGEQFTHWEEAQQHKAGK
jgi:hypothetical protein